MFLKIFIPIWIVCGFMAYGLMKGNFKHLSEFDGREYIRGDEFLCWFVGVLGPIGLVAVLWNIGIFSEEFRFCLKMPEELKEGYG